MSIDLSEETNELHQTIQELMQEIASYKKKIASMQNCLDIQGSDGNWNYDEYMRGMFNGMELMMSIMEDREPVYKTAKEAEKKPIWSNHKCKYCGGDTMCVGDICYGCNQKYNEG